MSETVQQKHSPNKIKQNISISSADISSLALLEEISTPSIITPYIVTPVTADDADTNFSIDDDEKILMKYGYKKLDKIRDTLQGVLFKAEQLETNQYVAVKKTDKTQFKQGIAIQNGFNFIVTENRLKESLILKYLTIDNKVIGEYIIKFIDFFESNTAYYLVTEYIDSQINLKEFIQTAHQYVAVGRLKVKSYHKIIKYLYWQLMVTIHWLHNDMNCCHLDICGENILLENCNFTEKKDGKLRVNPSISIKLIDFGVAELFQTDQATRSLKTLQPFCCNKQHLTLENESYLAPKICSDELYNARSSDIWSLGMVFYECMTGKPLYEPMQAWQPLSSLEDLYNNGYLAMMNGTLYEYLLINNKFKYFDNDSFDLLNKLLNINENERIDAFNALKHEWFHLYFKKYHKRIKDQTDFQNKQFIENKQKMKNFPFYTKPSITK